MALAAVIVTFNSAEVIDSCLEALSSMAPEVAPIVVDNASKDNTVERARRHANVLVVTHERNLGFAAAANVGVKAAGNRELILLLNPDAELITQLSPLLESARRHGIAGGRLVGQDGAPQQGFTIRRFPTPAALALELLGVNRLWPSNPVNRRYRYLDRDLCQAGSADQPAGAFLLFRREVWTRLGGFDERFFPLWFEDVDFCRRAVDAGFGIEYVPSVAACHHGSHSMKSLSNRARAIYWCVSLLRYGAKHFPTWSFRGICAVVVLTSLPRMVAGMIAERDLSPVVTYSKIMRFAGLCLVSPKHMCNSAVTVL